MAIEVYSKQNIQIKNPDSDYGYQISELIKNSPPLDLNSTYLYFIQSHYFNKTCAIAVNEIDRVIGFVSGFQDPRKKDTLFIWQVAISKDARGNGLASKLIHFILQEHPHMQFIETTITKDNTSSISLFNKISQELNTNIIEEPFLDKTKHFLNQHDSENLFRIGPFKILKENP
jgi:L-2,4-diaminobutyric acid acetyltransferase